MSGSRNIAAGAELFSGSTPLASRQDLSSSTQNFSPSQFIAKILGASAKKNLGKETRDELTAISRSKNPKRFFREILGVGKSLAEDGQVQVAGLLFSETVRQLEQDFTGRPANYRELIAEARERLEALQGHGPLALQFENLLQSTRREFFNPIGFASFFAATATYLPLRYNILKNLLPAGRFFSTGQKLRAHALAVSLGTTGELGALVGTGRGLRTLAGIEHPMSLEHEIYSAAMMVPALKFTGSVGRGIVKKIQKAPVGKLSPLGMYAMRLGQWAIPHGMMVGGVMTVLKREEQLGWRDPKDFSGLLLESMATVGHIWLSGKALEWGLGRRYQKWTQSYQLGFEEILRGPPNGPSAGERVLAYLRARGLVPEGGDPTFSKHWGQKRHPHIFHAEGDRGTGSVPPKSPSEELAYGKTQQRVKVRVGNGDSEEVGRAKTGEDLGRAETGEDVARADTGEDVGRAHTVMAPMPQARLPRINPDQMATMDAPPGTYSVPPRGTVPPTSHAEIGIGSHLGEPLANGRLRYEVVAKLGEGGQGEVYRVIDHKVKKKPRAIKVIRGDLHPDKIARAMRESEIGMDLETKKVAKVLDTVRVGNLLIPVYEYVKGEPLEDILYRIKMGDAETIKNYSREKRRDIFVKIAEAVTEIHSEDVVHRDLKPANIMVTDKGEVVILDLGIGKDLKMKNGDRMPTIAPPPFEELDNHLTRTGTFFGTPGYWAPETLAPKENFTKNPFLVDQFALGSILQEMMTGFPTFIQYKENPVGKVPRMVPALDHRGDYEVNKYAVLQLTETMRPPNFKDVVAEPLDDVTLELEAVARKAMAPKPGDRYPSVEQLRRAVALAPSRVKKQEMDQVWGEMQKIRKQFQENSEHYRLVQITEPMWEGWDPPIRSLLGKHQKWEKGIDALIGQIEVAMKGENWPEGKRMIAPAAWERLMDVGHRNPADREWAMQKIRENDIPLEDGTITGMKEALDGKVTLSFKVTDYMTDEALNQEVLVRVFPFEKEFNSQGEETRNFKKGKFIYHGPIKDGRIPIDLPEGFYIFHIYSRGYALSPKTLHVTLEDVRQGIGKGKNLDLAVEMLPKEYVPKGMIYIPEMEVYIGDDPIQINMSPLAIGSQPQHKITIGPFLMDKYLGMVREYRAFLEAKLKEKKEEMEKETKLSQNKKNKKIEEAMEPLRPRDPQNGKTAPTLKQKAASLVDKLRKKQEAVEEDHFYWRLVKVKEEGEWVWTLNNPKNPTNTHKDPIHPRQPVDAISPFASFEFLNWLSETQKDNLHGRKYRLGEISELEGVAKGGLPIDFPFGDWFDPFKMTSRSTYPDLKKGEIMRVGRHPVRGFSEDRSPLGPIDVIGGNREFSSTSPEEGTILLFGGSASTFNGVNFRPSNRVPFSINEKHNALGFRKFLNLPKKIKKGEPTKKMGSPDSP